MGKRKRDSTQAKTEKRGKYEDISKAFGSKLTVQKTKKRPFVESWFDELMNCQTGKIEPEGVEERGRVLPVSFKKRLSCDSYLLDFFLFCQVFEVIFCNKYI